MLSMQRSPGLQVMLVLVLLVWLAPAHADVRDYYFGRIDSSQGLAQNSVSLIYQDTHGYMWLATEGGLHRYDGYRLKHYQHDSSRRDSLPGNLVQALADTGDGRLWLAQIGGPLIAFDATANRTLPLPADVVQAVGHVATLNRRNAHTLLIGSSNGAFLLDTKTLALTALWHSPSPLGSVYAVSQCPNGDTYALAGSILLRFGTDRGETKVVNDGLHGMRTVLCRADGRLLAAGSGGLIAVDVDDGATSVVWPAAQGGTPTATDVTDLVQDHAGNLWLAVAGTGLVRLDREGRVLRVLRPQPGVRGTLPETHINTLMVDQSGLLWVGGATHGAFYTDPGGSPFDYHFDGSADNDATVNNNVRSLKATPDGTVWIGLAHGGLRSYDPATDVFTDRNAAFAKVLTPSEIDALRVFAIAPDGAGLRLATSLGLYHVDPQRSQARRLYPDASVPGAAASVRALVHARNGSWWLGIFGEGVLEMRNAEVVRRVAHDPAHANSLASNEVLSLAEDDRGNLWAGTMGGLSRIATDGSVESFRETPGAVDSLTGNVVADVFVDANNNVWVGTQTGLSRVLGISRGKARFQRYLVGDDLPDNTIYCIQADASHKLWLSTNLGVARLDPVTGQVRPFTLRDGLQGMEYNSGACADSPSGRLLFGGINGFDSVQPQALAAAHFSPPVVISSVNLGISNHGSPLPVDETLVMPWPNRTVHFEFAAMDFAAPMQNRFQYRLAGFDAHWIDAGTRHSATYTNLDAGTYQFEVRGSNHQGVFGTHVATLTMHVLPPWWKSTWALALYGLLIALGIAACILMLRARRASARLHQGQLRERENRLSMALWGSGDAFWDLDLRANRLFRAGNDADQGIWSSRDISLDDWRNHVVHPDDLETAQAALDGYLAGSGEFFEHELRVRDGAGWRWIRTRGQVVDRDDAGHPLRICGTARNVDEDRHAESDRRIAAEVIRSMSEAVTVNDLDFNFRSVNPAFTRMTGYTEREIIGTNAAILNSEEHQRDGHALLRRQVADSGHWRGEAWQKRKDGSELLCWVEISGVCGADGVRTHYVAVMTDITERKRNEQELRYLANYDVLTGLPNRTLLSARLDNAIAGARRKGTQLAVLYVDLDRFKHINDSMGHSTGDQLLAAAGNRLRQCVRDQDTVARVGGDEFTLVIEDTAGSADAEAAAARIIQAFARPLVLETRQEVLISPSIGIAMHPRHGNTVDDLLKFADTAMYQAKEHGRNVWAMYTEAMHRSASVRASMTGSLRRALQRDEIHVVYQPKLDIVSQRIIGVEALLRWVNPELGQVPPAIFIPLAEESGLIVELGEFVLRRACSDLATWRAQGLTGLTMAVNLSMTQLLRNELPQVLRNVLAEHDLPAQSLELELTESMVMANVEHSVRMLGEFKTLGVSLAIDDFGTGYSSLAYLKRLPIDTLKVDRDFVGDITLDPEDATITATIITMAHSLGMDVVAEGVETEEQLAFLVAHGCDAIQGNLFSPALSADACVRLCATHGTAASSA